MPEITLAIVDRLNGDVLVDDEGAIGQAVQAALAPMLGNAEGLGCARPYKPMLTPAMPTKYGQVRYSGLWHDSMIEGPGRRSVVRLQGCPIRCVGCHVPETWDENGGLLGDVDVLAKALLDPAYTRDGVTILGGEPFAQPFGLAMLVLTLKRLGAAHVLVYTGYTLESLQRRAEGDPYIALVLAEIDTLIDGPFIVKQQPTAGAWTGSGNQRVIQLKEVA